MININGKEWNKLKLKDIEKFLLYVEDDETFFIEFKDENIRNTQLTKELSAFANSYGGYLFLGVDDSKNIIGCTNKWTELKINTIICNGISPMPQIDIKKFNLSNNKKLYVIKVEEGLNPPYVTNDGHIYHRVSSSSDRVKDSNTLNNLYQKSKDNIKKIEQKIYIPEITGQIPENLCGYIDFGFSLVTRNLEKTKKNVKEADINKISELLKKNNQKYSISKVGFSISITVGEASLKRGNEEILTNGGLMNFMEILPDGSFRCRIIITSEKNSSIASITSITLIHSLFCEIYKIVFGNSFASNFIEAQHYEKLTVLKLFQPKILVHEEDKYKHIFDEFYKEHLMKYGNNIIVNSNRVPMSGFFIIDKSIFDLNKIKFNSENLYSQLFYTTYHLLGYVNKFPSIPVDDDENQKISSN